MTRNDVNRRSKRTTVSTNYLTFSIRETTKLDVNFANDGNYRKLTEILDRTSNLCSEDNSHLKTH